MRTIETSALTFLGYMTRDPILRAGKYDATVISARFAAERDGMVEQMQAKAAELAEVERHAGSFSLVRLTKLWL